jgi:hypothetical protein
MAKNRKAAKPPKTQPNRENKSVPELMKYVPTNPAEASAQTELNAAKVVRDIAWL